MTSAEHIKDSYKNHQTSFPPPPSDCNVSLIRSKDPQSRLTFDECIEDDKFLQLAHNPSSNFNLPYNNEKGVDENDSFIGQAVCICSALYFC